MSQPQPPGLPGPPYGVGPGPWAAGAPPPPGVAPWYPPAPAPRPVAPDGRPLGEVPTRLLAYVIDAAVSSVVTLPGILALYIALFAWLGRIETDATFSWPRFPAGTLAAGAALLLVGSLVTYWNVGRRQGATGQSIGKQAVGLRLVREADGRPLGSGWGLLRVLIRGGLGAASGGVWSTVTVLWPLWDPKRQTLEDKLLHTLVVSER